MPEETTETQTATMSPEDEFDAAAAVEFPDSGVEAPQVEPEKEPAPDAETQPDEESSDPETPADDQVDDKTPSEPVLAKEKFGEFDTLDELVAAYKGKSNLESVVGRQGEELGKLKAENEDLRGSDLALLARTNPDKAQEILDGIREKTAGEWADSVASLTADPDAYIENRVAKGIAKALETVQQNRDYSHGLKTAYGDSWDALAASRQNIDDALRVADPRTGKPPLGWDEALQLMAIGRGVRDKTYRTGSTEEKPLPVTGAPGGGGSQAPIKTPDSTKPRKSPEDDFDEFADAHLDPDGGGMIHG